MHVPGRHRAVAPEGHRDARLAATLERERRADDEWAEVAEHRHEREDAAFGDAEVHVPVAAEGRPGRAAEEVPQDVGDRHAARVVARLLAVERRDDVVGAEREPGAGRDRLLHVARVDAADDPPLAVERHDPLLRQALQEHEAEELAAGLGSTPGASTHSAQ